jgi:hypothetical protein
MRSFGVNGNSSARYNPSLEQVQITSQGNESIKVVFNIENNAMNLVNMIHFGIIELLFKINADICDSYKMDVENEKRARLTLVLKHILKDLGVPQMYADVLIVREDSEDLVTLTITHISSFHSFLKGEKEEGKGKEEGHEEYEVIPVKSVVIKFGTKNIHKIDVCIDVFYNNESDSSSSSFTEENPLNSQNIQNFVDKMLKTLTKNIINRLKQFIEKMPYSNNTLSNNNDNAI